MNQLEDIDFADLVSHIRKTCFADQYAVDSRSIAMAIHEYLGSDLFSESSVSQIMELIVDLGLMVHSNFRYYLKRHHSLDPKIIAGIPRMVDFHLTGSCLVDGINPNDHDYVVLVKSKRRAAAYLNKCGFAKDGVRIYSAIIVADHDIYQSYDYQCNIICTDNPIRYGRWIGFSRALKRLQLKSREDRVSLAKTCIDD